MKRHEEILASKNQNEYEKQQWKIQNDIYKSKKESEIKNKRHAILQQTQAIAENQEDDDKETTNTDTWWWCF